MTVAAIWTSRGSCGFGVYAWEEVLDPREGGGGRGEREPPPKAVEREGGLPAEEVGLREEDRGGFGVEPRTLEGREGTGGGCAAGRRMLDMRFACAMRFGSGVWPPR